MAYALHQLLHDASRSHPTREAVRCWDRALSYEELDAASTRLAAVFVQHGVRAGDRVGIYLPKCVEMVVAVYGAMKAGAAYVPLDPRAPVSRAATVADDCAISALVSSEHGAASLVDAMDTDPVRLAILVSDPARGAEKAETGGEPACPTMGYEAATTGVHLSDPAVSVVDQDVAYILYTSGSTGTPKGVMLTHRNALTFVDWCESTIGIEPSDRLSNHAPLHFDLSVFDLFFAARGAATVVLVPEEHTFFGSELAAFIEREEITIWYSVPSALMLLEKSIESRSLTSLRTIVFAGEVYPTKRLRELRARLPGVDLWNLYGPTETNVCTYYRVDDIPPDDRTIPIGQACDNTEVFAIRDDGSVATPGDVGELYVRGSTVMKGYWGRPEASVATLLPDPRGHHRDLVYRTGDLVRLRPDGEYEFLGRRDHQIKSRGFRIELAEIEIALNNHASVARAVTVAAPHEEWGTEIIAFVQLEEAASLGEKDARKHVATRLPRYMVPSRVIFVDELPRTSTGKVDRRELMEGLRANRSTTEASKATDLTASDPPMAPQ